MIKHILLATNGSKTSISAEDHALNLAQAFQARLTVVHVEDDRLAHYGEVDQLMSEVTKDQFVSYINENNDAETRRILNNFCRKADKRSVNYVILVKSGKPERKIVALAQEKAVDLLVIGSGARSSKPFTVSSNIAGKITKYSPCPVFTAI